MSVVVPDRGQVLAHLADLYGTADAGFLAVWHDRTRRTDWFEATELDAAAEAVVRAGAEGNVYVGVGLHPAPLGPERRGDSAGVCAIPGLFVDIDVADPGHQRPDLPPDGTAVRELLAATTLPPASRIVRTGGGWHCYWLFKEVWAFENETERLQALRLNRHLQWAVISAGRRKGWWVDNTADLSRVLRPAGTVRRKAGADEFLVATRLRDGPRYGIEDLADRLPLEDEFFPASAVAGSGGQPRRVPAAHWSRVKARCGFMRHCETDAATLSEPEWHAAMTVIGRCVDGEAIAHRVSRPYPGYDQKETARKFAYARSRDNPVRCETVRLARGGEPWCSACPFRGQLASPIELGYPTGYRLELEPRSVS